MLESGWVPKPLRIILPQRRLSQRKVADAYNRIVLAPRTVVFYQRLRERLAFHSRLALQNCRNQALHKLALFVRLLVKT
jgi:hypothetical protein